jgi:hypothetical protein
VLSGVAARQETQEMGWSQMSLMLVALLVVIVLALLGFGLHWLWWIALIALVVWLLGFMLRARAGTGSRRRWYRW